MTDTYEISDRHFGYFNDMAAIDLIVEVPKRENYNKARKIVEEEISNWCGCEDDDADYSTEGYTESAERRLKAEGIDVTFYISRG